MTFATRPTAPSDYRLASGAARSRIAHVAVAPLVRFRGMKNASTLRGDTRPVFPGARSPCNGWTEHVDDGRACSIDANGRFDAHFRSLRATTGRDSRPAAASSRASAHPPRRARVRRLALAAFLLALAAPAPRARPATPSGCKGRLAQARRTADRGSHRPPGLGRSRPSPLRSSPGRRCPPLDSRRQPGSSGCATTLAGSRSRRTTRSPDASGTSTAFMLSRPGASCRSSPKCASP